MYDSIPLLSMCHPNSHGFNSNFQHVARTATASIQIFSTSRKQPRLQFKFSARHANSQVFNSYFGPIDLGFEASRESTVGFCIRKNSVGEFRLELTNTKYHRTVFSYLVLPGLIKLKNTS